MPLHDVVAPHEGGVRIACGIPKSGKTFGIKRDVFIAARSFPICVIDTLGEWNTQPRGLRCFTFDSARRALMALEAGKFDLAVVRSRNPAIDGSEAVRWAVSHKGRAGVAIPEAHMVFPRGPRLPDHVMRAVCQWRHPAVDVALWLDTQRLANLDTTIREQARELRIYATSGKLDLQAVEAISPELLTVVLQANQKMQTESGWHATCGAVRLPPFKLSR